MIRLNSREFRIVSSIVIMMIMGAFSFNMFLPSLPAIQKSFEAPHSWVSWLLSAGLASRALMSLVFGPMADRRGRKPAMAAGLVVCFAGSLSCALARSFAWVFVGRTLLASGSVAVFVVTRAIIVDAFGRGRASQIASMTALITFVAPLAAPFAGGYVTEWWSWRGIFWLTLCMQIVSMSVILFWLPETAEKAPKEQRRDWNRIIKDQSFWGYSLLMGLDQAAMFAFTTTAPFVMADVLGYTESQYGNYYCVYIAGMVAGNMVNARLAPKFQARTFVAAGIAITALAGVMFAASALAGWINQWTLFAAGSVGALGGTLIFVNASVAGVANMGSQTATASGIAMFCQIAAMAVGVHVVGQMYDRWPLALFWFMPACYVVMAATWAAVRRRLTE